MKILYVVTGLGLGGAEKVVADLADQMVLRGHVVKIAYLKGDVLVKPKSEHVELIYLGLESGKKLIAASQKYRQLIQQYHPDVIHAHMVHANIFARLNRIGCKVPKLICTAHNSNEGGKIRMLAYRYTNFLSDFNTNVSQEAVQAFIEKGAFTSQNAEHIYNGINLEKFIYQVSKEQQEKISLLSIGRLNEQKDYPNLLNALVEVCKVFPKIHLNIAGEGELRSEIEALIEQLKLNQYVTLLGRRDDVPSLMQQADFFILSSKYEGFGLVVAEAMACGTFVIATDCGGVREVMGTTGLLVSPQNSQMLADAVIHAIELSEAERLDNNNAALAHVRENFDLNKVAQKWEQIYESE
ncbi:glycosyltransferase [Wohlfahrtiimonas larvae]|uniref:Glycosyltransferase n=1 Tax=Wohlfahrtiimonas larvae TaxID=1157986 RepID=A0ABP9MGE9_9GAMM|nr:glycosyltransferase [Wohlfahrtiimonas larvae]